MATDLKKDLQAVYRELKVLTKKVEKMIVTAEKTEKPKTAKKTVAKKAVAKKSTNSSAKKAAAKKGKKVTAIDTVLDIINRSRKGIDVSGLKKKTGYDAPKIYRAVKALKKKGRIKTVRMGVYVKA